MKACKDLENIVINKSVECHANIKSSHASTKTLLSHPVDTISIKALSGKKIEH